MTEPVLSVDAFLALARSSPWRWRTLHFRHRSDGGEVEAWVRRPGDLLVVDADGRRHRVAEEAGGSAVVMFSTNGVPPAPPSEPEWLTPDQVAPPLRADGLVSARPDDWQLCYGDPMWGNYQWVAMLDPHELSHSVDVRNPREDSVGGRPSWRADLWALPGYDPQCGCCELLWSEVSWEVDNAGEPIPVGTVYPDHYDVTLDVQTGIVVRLAPVGETSHPALGFENDILEVDADLDDVFA
ncbi:hypothetical protein HNR19_003453 [Nocardioides thalensis]|uniref:Uncharacterized protein n=1 Tax=Nocardioides thalensis TaxID=1914755 RepID=A0A853C4T0_9ACTN|nr:hypothetical protein [Nocardioides thalensis]NYJ02755.1 hypothetical protein [Nocardioides thalensis]